MVGPTVQAGVAKMRLGAPFILYDDCRLFGIRVYMMKPLALFSSQQRACLAAHANLRGCTVLIFWQLLTCAHERVSLRNDSSTGMNIKFGVAFT